MDKKTKKQYFFRLFDLATIYTFMYNRSKDGKRTETVTGYRYVVCLAEHRLEKLSVRIDGPQQMEQPEGFVDVEFTDLVVTGYESQGKLQFSAKASGIFPVD